MQGIVQMFILCVKKAWRNKQISQNNLYEYWLSPCMTTILFCLMNKNQDVRLILAGVSVMILWSVNIFECAYIVIDEKVRGTLGYMLMSPFHTQFILFSEALSTVLFNVPVILVAGIVTYCICPYVLGWNMIIWFAAAYVLSILSIATIGVLIASLLLFTRSARGIMNIIEYPFFILSGLLVPVEKLPGWIGWISGLLPSTHAFDIFRAAVLGEKGGQMGSIAKCLLSMILLQVITGAVIAYTRRQVIVKGTMDVY